MPKNYQKINRCKLLIIDEISTMNLTDFGKLHRRCQLIRNCFRSLFGGLNVIIVGDFGQLKPVLGKMLFQKISIDEINMDEVVGSCIYQIFKKNTNRKFINFIIGLYKKL